MTETCLTGLWIQKMVQLNGSSIIVPAISFSFVIVAHIS